jgi:hypothetical protein
VIPLGMIDLETTDLGELREATARAGSDVQVWVVLRDTPDVVLPVHGVDVVPDETGRRHLKLTIG